MSSRGHISIQGLVKHGGNLCVKFQPSGGYTILTYN